jgi:uncharacterized protein (TIGR01777 family)
MRVFLTGGTGLVGNRLIRRLRERNDHIVLLTRRPQAVAERLGKECQIVEGDPMKSGPWMDVVQDCDAVINLAGEGILARRWDADFKALLRDSRVRTTENVVQAIARQPNAPIGSRKVLVNASAIGYYGPLGDEPVTEDHPPGSDILGRICVDWEDATRGAEAAGVRVARVRIGVVLDPEGGALKQLVTPFKMFAGGPAGSGTQWMSWIHYADLVGILLLALDNGNVSGPINGTAPNPVTNKQFAQSLGRALHRPSFVPTPGFALRLMLGEGAHLILTGQRVLPAQALKLGYQFQFPTLDEALADLLR